MTSWRYKWTKLLSFKFQTLTGKGKGSDITKPDRGFAWMIRQVTDIGVLVGLLK